jgi:hypothetical protein
MIYKNNNSNTLISVGLVGCMLVVAWSEYWQGAQIGDVHLITPAPLVAGSTIANTNAIMYHQHTIIEAEYAVPARSSPLRHDALVYPST